MSAPSAVHLPLAPPRRIWRLRFLALLAYYGALLATLVVIEEAGASLGLRDGSTNAALWRVALLTMGSMLGAIVLTLPVAWVHWIASPGGGKDRSVLETLVLLPAAVSAIVLIVQNNITLALSLAGIVAAVRFRNNLKESADAVYVFVSIGLGLAAGTQAIVLGAVMSGVFSLIVLAVARLKSGGDTWSPIDVPIETLPSTVLARAGSPSKDGKRKAVLLVQAAPQRPAWHAVEDVLRKRAKRWRLVEGPTDTVVQGLLEYRIRLKRKTSPDRLIDELRRRGASDILAAELRLV